LILLSEILVLWRLWVLLGLCCRSSFSFVRMVSGRPDAPLSVGLDSFSAQRWCPGPVFIAPSIKSTASDSSASLSALVFSLVCDC
jgi:hypothetical protein